MENLTVEQYEAWLATNPEFTAFKVVARKVAKAAVLCVDRVIRLFKRVRRRSCLAGVRVGRTVYPLSYDKNSGYTRAGFRLWLQGVARELQATREHIDRISAFDFLPGSSWADPVYNTRLQRIAKVEDEIAMEHTLEKALEILHKIKK